MVTQKIYDEDGSGFYRVFEQENIERVNPIEYFKNYEIEKYVIMLKDLLAAKEPELVAFVSDESFKSKAEELLEGFFEKFEQTQIQPNLEQLLTTYRKKDQVRLLRGVYLTPEELMAFTFKAYKDHGYLFSRYSFKNSPKRLEGQQRPKLLELNTDTGLRKIGPTNLTEGQLKNLILLRRVIVSNFFEKEDVWHCFFITYESIAGRENHKNGQPHFHYISSGFGVTKEDVIEGMRTGNYLSTPVHIDLLDYGVQPT